MNFESLKTELEKIEEKYYECMAGIQVEQELMDNALNTMSEDEYDTFINEYEPKYTEEDLNQYKNDYFAAQLNYLMDLLKDLGWNNIWNTVCGTGNSWYFDLGIGKIRFSNHSQVYDADINIGYTTLDSNQINDDGMNLDDATEYLTKKAKEYWESED
jgi:hypothetical protein